MMLSISASKFLVAETSFGDYNFHRWTSKPTEYYFVNSKHTIIKNAMVLDWY